MNIYINVASRLFQNLHVAEKSSQTVVDGKQNILRPKITFMFS